MPRKREADDHDLLIQIVEKVSFCHTNIGKIEQNFEEHLRRSNEILEKYIPLVNKMMEELPNKGFCGKMEHMYNDLYSSSDTHDTLVKKVAKINNDIYPDNDESIPQKVNQMWEGYRLIKWVLATSMGAFLVSIVTLLTRYVFPT